jgi:hypothetical protein
MPRPIIYDPNDDVNIGNWESFVWQPEYIAYVQDGEDVTAAITNRTFIESLYGLTDHVQYLYFLATDTEARTTTLYTKLGVDTVNTPECFAGTYINGCKTFLQALNLLDAGLVSVANLNTTDHSKLTNIISRLSPSGGPYYGAGADIPLFSGDGVTGGLIGATERVHTAINLIAAQVVSDRDELATQVTRVDNIVDNFGTDADAAHGVNNPDYNLDAGVTIIANGDTLLEALNQIANYLIGPGGSVVPDLSDYPILTRVREVVGKTDALDAATTVYQDGADVANLIVDPLIDVTAETVSQAPAHHQALVLYDNLLEGSLRQEEAMNQAMLDMQCANLPVIYSAAVNHFETANPLFIKNDPLVAPAASFMYRHRKVVPSAAPSWLVSISIDLTDLGGNATHVMLIPAVDDLANADTDFEFWVNASDYSSITPTAPVSTQILAAAFGTWVALDTPASGGGRVQCKFLTMNGVLRGWRVLFAAEDATPVYGPTGPTGAAITGPSGVTGPTGAALTGPSGVTGPTGAALTGPTGP